MISFLTFFIIIPTSLIIVADVLAHPSPMIRNPNSIGTCLRRCDSNSAVAPTSLGNIERTGEKSDLVCGMVVLANSTDWRRWIAVGTTV